MAKPKTPLLSLGARGTIADTLTFQKRGKGHFVRQKPIPKDPKSPAQLARRQIYRDAVAVWNALSLEEKEAWRGVCPGLTAYQCFMKSELPYVPPVPPPEEYTEEQTDNNFDWNLNSLADTRSGQRLFISNRKVSKLGFLLWKANDPTGDVTFTIRRVSDNGIILSKVWGDAADLTPEVAYEEAEFDTPTLINQEVRTLVEFSGGNLTHQVRLRIQLADVKAEEYFTHFKTPDWTDQEAWDCAYRYKYYLP